MQDHLTGDFGDYVKYALLRSLAPNRTLGIAWYKNTSGWPHQHGNTIQYLNNRQQWRPRAPEVFDTLQAIVQNGRRATSLIEASGLLPRARYANEPQPIDTVYPNPRRQWREEWFERTLAKLHDRNLVYIDPDTGICRNGDFTYGDLGTWGHVPIHELRRLELDAQGNRRPVVVYHTPHRNADHHQQIQDWKGQLNCDYAFHVPSQGIDGQITGPRIFFILNPDEPMVNALNAFSNTWQDVGHLD